ncbi:MAG: zinc-ribbon domain-containing protein, partial [Chitinivibrionales bacterium]|nr:zinc-ribbon domain-containing protein [Chitinivibrionales bacterium]
MKRKRRHETVICPHCGAEIRKDAKACPECGSDERTGWSESSYSEGFGLPDEEEYNDMVAREFGGRHAPKRKARVPWVYVAVAAALLA